MGLGFRGLAVSGFGGLGVLGVWMFRVFGLSGLGFGFRV